MNNNKRRFRKGGSTFIKWANRDNLIEFAKTNYSVRNTFH